MLPQSQNMKQGTSRERQVGTGFTPTSVAPSKEGCSSISLLGVCHEWGLVTSVASDASVICPAVYWGSWPHLFYTNSKLRLAELPYNPFCVVVFFFPSTLLLYFLKWPLLTTPNSYYSVSLLMTLYVYVGFCGFKESTSYFPIF